jgi:hypothetical protein
MKKQCSESGKFWDGQILLFSSVAFKSTKGTFFSKVILLITYGTSGTFTSILNDNKSYGSHKTEEIKVFSNYFAMYMECSGSLNTVKNDKLCIDITGDY